MGNHTKYAYKKRMSKIDLSSSIFHQKLSKSEKNNENIFYVLIILEQIGVIASCFRYLTKLIALKILYFLRVSQL